MNKDIFIIVAGRACQVLIGFATIRVGTHFLSPKEFGFYSFFLALASYFSLLLVNPVGQYVTRKVNNWHQRAEVAPKTILFCFYVLFVALSSLGIIFILGNNWISFPVPGLKFPLLISGFILFQSLSMSLISIFNILGFQTYYVVLSTFSSLLGFLSSFFYVSNFQASAFWWLAGQICGFIITLPFVFASIKTITKSKFQLNILMIKKFKPHSFKKISKYVLPLMAATFFLWLQNDAFRLIVEKFSGVEYLGYLSVAYMISMKLGLTVETLATQIFCPIFFKSISDSDKENRQRAWNKLFQQTIPIYFIMGVFVSGLAPFLTKLLAAPSYQRTWSFLALICWAQALRSMSNIGTTVAHAEYATSKLIFPQAIGGIATAAMTILAASSSIFYWGIPMALVLGALLTFMMVYWRMSRLLKSPWTSSLLIQFLLFSPVLLWPLFFTRWSSSTFLSTIPIIINGILMLSFCFILFRKHRII